ncbi:MAG: DUF1549 and DUF1553 domain-containing protein [Planctomycetaceae bacterium]
MKTVFSICSLFLVAAVVTTLAEEPEGPPLAEPPITDVDFELPGLQPLVRPTVPETQNTEWPANAIDQFILSQLEDSDLAPVEQASRLTLLRRISFDVRGLPPSMEEIERYVTAENVPPWSVVVNDMLADSAYGERWAQHWLDLVRFAETDGFEHDKVRPEAWRYRDWVINAFNDNLPYDQFISLQLAGDELAPDDLSARIATGYLMAGPDMPDINLQEERRHSFLNGMTANLGEVVFGLQFGCAQCHDHKADPISQADFYRLRACFETIDLFKEPALKVAGEENEKKLRVVQNSENPSPSHLWIRGDFRRPGPELQPAAPRVIDAALERFLKAEAVSVTSETPRTDLARWAMHPQNPLPARVMVNRMWQHHFGVGLVSTSSDWGWMGTGPTHPELLDWLAVELIESGWDLKHIHRLILNSATYQLASRRTGESSNEVWDNLLEHDPDNQLLGRARRRRLNGEAIRDALLSVSGQLNRKQGGPGVRPPLPQEVVGTLLKDQWPVTKDASEHTRRSIYLFARRNLRFPLFEAFDKPDSNLSCPIRVQTTIAPQALHLLNSEFVMESANKCAERVLKAESTEAARIQLLSQLTFGRPPTEQEMAQSVQFLKSSEEPNQAWPDLCHAFFNSNEFVYND